MKLLWALYSIVKWLWLNSYLYTEFTRAEDALYTAGLNLSANDEEAKRVFAAWTNQELPTTMTAKFVFDGLNCYFAPVRSSGSTVDLWILLMRTMDNARREKFKAGEHEEAAKIRLLMNYLHAFNRDKEIGKHLFLAQNEHDISTASFLKNAYNGADRQYERFRTGVKWFPTQRGGALGKWEIALCILLIIPFTLINGLTEPISSSFQEWVGVARNVIQRPRTLLQVPAAFIRFPYVDVYFLWEIIRQRSFGAFMSFVLFSIVAIHRQITGKPTLYENNGFIIATGILSVSFQITVQLGDVMWHSLICLRAGKNVRPEMSWPMYLVRWFFGKMPLGSADDQRTYRELDKFSKRSAAWAVTYDKSRPMQLVQIAFVRNRITARDIYAACAGIRLKLVYDLAFWIKCSYVLSTMGVWLLTAICLWRQWVIFNVIMAFHAAVALKLWDFMITPEQEAKTAGAVFLNMVATALPSIAVTLIPSLVLDGWLDKAADLPPIVVGTTIATLWTDVVGKLITNVVTSITNKVDERSRQAAFVQQGQEEDQNLSEDEV